MIYVSTRGHADRKHFCEILLEGLAPDGGLYLPIHYPKIDAAMLAQWRGLAYHELAFEILSLYIDDIPAADLRAICRKTYTAEVFGSKEIAPLKQLGLSDRPLATAWLPDTAGTLDDHFEGWFLTYPQAPSAVPEGLESVADLGQGQEWLPPPDDPALEAEGAQPIAPAPR